MSSISEAIKEPKLTAIELTKRAMGDQIMAIVMDIEDPATIRRLTREVVEFLLEKID